MRNVYFVKKTLRVLFQDASSETTKQSVYPFLGHAGFSEKNQELVREQFRVSAEKGLIVFSYQGITNDQAALITAFTKYNGFIPLHCH